LSTKTWSKFNNLNILSVEISTLDFVILRKICDLTIN